MAEFLKDGVAYVECREDGITLDLIARLVLADIPGRVAFEDIIISPVVSKGVLCLKIEYSPRQRVHGLTGTFYFDKEA